MAEFRKAFDEFQVQSLALNDSMDDTRCDGLTMGLYRKLEKAIGAEVMAKVKRCSYSMLEELRAVKTPSEIEIMKECSRITTDIYDSLFKRIHVGLSEIDVAKIMMEECEKRNVCTALGNPRNIRWFSIPREACPTEDRMTVISANLEICWSLTSVSVTTAIPLTLPAPCIS